MSHREDIHQALIEIAKISDTGILTNSGDPLFRASLAHVLTILMDCMKLLEDRENKRCSLKGPDVLPVGKPPDLHSLIKHCRDAANHTFSRNHVVGSGVITWTIIDGTQPLPIKLNGVRIDLIPGDTFINFGKVGLYMRHNLLRAIHWLEGCVGKPDFPGYLSPTLEMPPKPVEWFSDGVFEDIDGPSYFTRTDGERFRWKRPPHEIVPGNRLHLHAIETNEKDERGFVIIKPMRHWPVV